MSRAFVPRLLSSWCARVFVQQHNLTLAARDAITGLYIYSREPSRRAAVYFVGASLTRRDEKREWLYISQWIQRRINRLDVVKGITASAFVQSYRIVVKQQFKEIPISAVEFVTDWNGSPVDLYRAREKERFFFALSPRVRGVNESGYIQLGWYIVWSIYIQRPKSYTGNLNARADEICN